MKHPPVTVLAVPAFWLFLIWLLGGLQLTENCTYTIYIRDRGFCAHSYEPTEDGRIHFRDPTLGMPFYPDKHLVRIVHNRTAKTVYPRGKNP